MVNRVPLYQEKMLPDFNFKMKFFVNFSTSSDKELSINFLRLCGNDDETKSKRIRKEIFKDLGCKDQKDFEKLFSEEINYIRDKIKEKIKQKYNYQGNKWFSQYIRDKILTQLHKEDKKK